MRTFIPLIRDLGVPGSHPILLDRAPTAAVVKVRGWYFSNWAYRPAVAEVRVVGRRWWGRGGHAVRRGRWAVVLRLRLVWR